MGKFIKFLNKRGRIIALVTGSGFVSIWTVTRFLTQRADFDLVGQQLLTRQWLSGSHELAWIGITHYVAKMLTIYTPLELLPGNPFTKLVIATVAINIVTFVLIFILLEKILALFKVKTGLTFYILMVWFASMAGSVFWIQYLNSRNLEVVGGLLLVYLALKYLKDAPARYFNKEIVIIFLVTAALVTADKLQLFMTVMPIVILTSASMLKSRKLPKSMVQLAVGLLAAAVLGLGLIKLTASVFNLYFVEPPHFDVLQPMSTWAHATTGAIKGFVAEFNGGFDLHKLHRVANILIAGLVLLSSLYVFAVKRSKRTPILLGTVYIFLNTLVYILSGQSLKEGTSRYLIMTVPALVFMAAATIPYINPTIRKCILAILVVASLLNMGAAIKLTYSKQQVSNAQQQELKQLTTDLQNNNYTYAYTSMVTALTGDYFVKPKVTLLPLSCDNGILHPSYLFFDKSLHRQAVTNQTQALIPVVFDGGVIKNHPAICTPESLVAQIGPPLKTAQVNGNTVLLYSPDDLVKLYNGAL